MLIFHLGRAVLFAPVQKLLGPVEVLYRGRHLVVPANQDRRRAVALGSEAVLVRSAEVVEAVVEPAHGNQFCVWELVS